MADFSITKCNEAPSEEELSTFIYNRYDLWDMQPGNSVAIWHYQSQDEDFYYETLTSGKEAKVGLWLMSISEEALQGIVTHCFKTYKKISRINLSNTLKPLRGLKEANHFKIELPDSADELEQRLSRKGRYNIRRERRIITERMGECSIEVFTADDPNAAGLWDAYFRFKEETYNNHYGLTPLEYCRRYHVTHVYSLVSSNMPDPLAVILSCEKTPTVYLENLAYNRDVSKLSAGQVLYDSYLKTLIEKGYKEIYLLGGDYSYKKRYGSIEETVYSGNIHRNKAVNIAYSVLRKVRNKLKR